ncbi:MAG: protein phosphatase 2C domain-containing protein [Gemmatimonadaceae bacterium]
MRTPDQAVLSIGPKPHDDEIDVFGLSHTGNVRAENEDHFLLATIHKHVHVAQSNLSEQARMPMEDERLAFIAMVADGVGGGESGEEASEKALEVCMHYLARSTDCYYRGNGSDESFINALQAAAMESHAAVIRRAQEMGVERTMATTLTMWMGVWPWYYLVQVGDSRYYLYREGKLSQVTRDQTIAQDLLDQGVFTRAMAARSQYSNVLSSALGGDSAIPVVTRMRADWNNVHLLCTDGLTKHVADDQIADRLANMTSAKDAAERLLQDALDAGGSDNISIIVGRAVPRRRDTAAH